MEITGTVFATTVGDFISGAVTPIANAIIKLAAPAFNQQRKWFADLSKLKTFIFLFFIYEA